MVFVKLNKTCCNLANFGSCFIIHSLGMGLFLFIDGPTLICGWVNFPIVWPHTPVQMKLKWPPGVFQVFMGQDLFVHHSGSPLLWNWILTFHLCISVVYWKSLCFAFSEVFKFCEVENINFVEYFVIDKHFFEQISERLSFESFLYEFLNSGDPLYPYTWYSGRLTGCTIIINENQLCHFILIVFNIYFAKIFSSH